MELILPVEAYGFIRFPLSMRSETTSRKSHVSLESGEKQPYEFILYRVFDHHAQNHIVVNSYDFDRKRSGALGVSILGFWGHLGPSCGFLGHPVGFLGHLW